MKTITFTKVLQVHDAYTPQASKHFLPEWYKDIPSYKDNKKMAYGQDTGEAVATLKKCMPVFDVITAGYIIPTYCDVWVTQRNGMPYYEWADVGLAPITWHPTWQTKGHPDSSDFIESPKFLNPWSIKTPPGYSLLVIPPTHHNLQIKILEGIVDTDSYTSPINFPFHLKSNSFEGLIPAGTPLAQVIPIKRDSWELTLGTDLEVKKAHEHRLQIRSKFYEAYKTVFWNKKEYK
jgi:hypothetical protein